MQCALLSSRSGHAPEFPQVRPWSSEEPALGIHKLAETNELESICDLEGSEELTGSLSNRTLFPAGFDPVAAGMTLVPEPTTALLLGLGLVGLSMRQRG